jgi:gamma-D-glutamyl-L-lysine dipeptidyl-peptidase
MDYGIANLSIVPVRKEASQRSEQVSQLLFGETFQIKEKQNGWLRIVTDYDHYEGWIDHKQYALLTQEQYKKSLTEAYHISIDLAQILVQNNTLLTLVLGSTLPSFDGCDCMIADEKFTYGGNVRNIEAPFDKNLIIENAYMYLNSPYLWGGKTPFGIDCSGFTQMAYKLAGIKLRRDAWQQAEQGHTINLLEETEPGDLAFFDNDEGNIVHVGIILRDHKIIHAAGKVRIDSIDHYGINNKELKKYTHKLRLIKRMV